MCVGDAAGSNVCMQINNCIGSKRKTGDKNKSKNRNAQTHYALSQIKLCTLSDDKFYLLFVMLFFVVIVVVVVVVFRLVDSFAQWICHR